MLKPVNAQDLVKVVHPADPAIDREKSDLEKYADELNITRISLKEGESATIFHLGSLSANQGEEIDKWTGTVDFDESDGVKGAKTFKGEFNDAAKAIQAFKYCVRTIENMPGVECNESKGHETLRNGVHVVSRKVLDLIQRQVAVDIGRMALKLNRIGEQDRKNS